MQFAKRPKFAKPFLNVFVKDRISLYLSLLATILLLINFILWQKKVVASDIVMPSSYQFSVINLGVMFLLINFSLLLPLHKKDVQMRRIVIISTIILEILVLIDIIYTLLVSGSF